MTFRRCTRCGRDVSAEAFKFQDDEGRPLCEACFRTSPPAGREQRREFGALRAVALVIKVVGFAALIGSLVVAHLTFARDAARAVESAISGILVFLICVALSEILRLGLSMESAVRRTAELVGRMLSMMEARGRGSGGDRGESEDKRPW